MSTSRVKERPFVKSVGTVSGATAFSRVLGLIREQVMAYFFGAGMATDAFVTAFRVPNLLRDMFAEGALSSAFVPVFKEKMVRETDEEAFSLANVVITATLLVVGLIVVLGIIASPVIIYISANGFVDTPGKFALTVRLTQWMFIYLLLVSLSALVMGMLNSYGRFGIPALSPAMFNAGMILPVLVLYRYFDQPVYTLAIGVVLGGAGQLAIQLPSLWRLGYRFRPRLDLLDEGLRKVYRLITPMILGMSAGRINILLSTLLASFLMEGSISYLNYSYRLMHFPLGVFAVALGTVALPRVSELAARGDRAGMQKALSEALGLNLLVVVPSAAFLALMGQDIVHLVYQWGAFSQLDADHTELALLHYSYGLIGFAAVRVTVPLYYALGDSRLPMKISMISVVINMALYYPMVLVLDFAGLAAATSIAGLVNFILLMRYLPAKGVPVSWGRLGSTFLRITVASVLAFYTARMIPVSFGDGLPGPVARALHLLVPAAAAVVAYFVLCIVLRVREMDLLFKALGRRQRSDQ